MDIEPSKTIGEGEFLKAAYEAANIRDPHLTLELVAENLNVSEELVALWIAGRLKSSDEEWLRLAKLLGFDAYKLRPELRNLYALLRSIDHPLEVKTPKHTATTSKEREAALVKAAYKLKKYQENGLTQELLAEEFGVTQGLVTQWFNAHSRIPDETLLELSERLNFDPFKVRPHLRDGLSRMSKIAFKDQPVDSINAKLEKLTPVEMSEVMDFVEFLINKRSP